MANVMTCNVATEKLQTFSNLEFMEENSQEDPSYNPEKEEMMNTEQELQNVSLTEKEDKLEYSENEEEENEENTIESDEENLEPEQIPIGLKEIKLLRKNQETTADCLVFPNEDDELPGQTINELDSEDLDDEDGLDTEFKAEEKNEEELEKEGAEDSDDENEERESIDGDDLKDVTEIETSNGNCKLLFPDVPKNKLEENEEEEVEDEEEEEEQEDKPYNEEEDQDFNPVMCGDTLSDIEIDEEEAEEEHEVLHHAEGTCSLKCDLADMKIPQESLENEMMEEDSQEQMECE